MGSQHRFGSRSIAGLQFVQVLGDFFGNGWVGRHEFQHHRGFRVCGESRRADKTSADFHGRVTG